MIQLMLKMNTFYWGCFRVLANNNEIRVFYPLGVILVYVYLCESKYIFGVISGCQLNITG